MVTLSVVSILAHIKEWILFYVLTINTILSWLFCICKICKFGFVSPFSSLDDNQCASLILCPCLNACLHPKCSRSKLEYDLKSRLFVVLCFSYCLFLRFAIWAWSTDCDVQSICSITMSLPGSQLLYFPD